MGDRLSSTNDFFSEYQALQQSVGVLASEYIAFSADFKNEYPQLNKVLYLAGVMHSMSYEKIFDILEN